LDGASHLNVRNFPFLRNPDIHDDRSTGGAGKGRRDVANGHGFYRLEMSFFGSVARMLGKRLGAQPHKSHPDSEKPSHE